MPDPSPLSRLIDALPDTLSRLMSDPAVSESLARADKSKRRLDTSMTRTRSRGPRCR